MSSARPNGPGHADCDLTDEELVEFAASVTVTAEAQAGVG